jgi:hypothetical protein
MLQGFPHPEVLRNGEEVFWFSRPVGRPALRGMDFYQMIISLVFVAAGVFMISQSGHISNASPAVGIAFGVFFILFALVAGFWRIWRADATWQQTIYALTSERVLKIVEFEPPQTFAYALSGVYNTRVDAKGSGTGSIFFSIHNVYDWAGNRPGNNGGNAIMDPNGVAFLNIPDVHHVIALMQKPPNAL